MKTNNRRLSIGHIAFMIWFFCLLLYWGQKKIEGYLLDRNGIPASALVEYVWHGGRYDVVVYYYKIQSSGYYGSARCRREDDFREGDILLIKYNSCKPVRSRVKEILYSSPKNI